MRHPRVVTFLGGGVRAHRGLVSPITLPDQTPAPESSPNRFRSVTTPRATYPGGVPSLAAPVRPPTTLVRRARRVARILRETYPEADCELTYTTPLELLIATVLSAQCTDKRVNAVTPQLFARYPDAQAFAAADRAELESIIRPTGFFRAKAESIQGIAMAICARFDGNVPASLEELVTLPGVGRKTANVVLGYAFGVPGITVDTHVGRLSRRLGWTTHTNPERVEDDLAALFPRKDWTVLSQDLIWHGRRCCHARKPACGACTVSRWCPSFGEGLTDPVEAAALVTTEGRA